MTKYVISGYIGFDNFGDEAILGALLSHLKKNNAEKITAISSNPEKTASIYGINSVKMLRFFNAIIKSDVLISGGGSLLQDVTSLKSLIYYLLVITTALILRKKVIIFAQGFTPFRTKIGEFLTRQILKKCHKISVRDEKSYKLLENLGIKSEQVADPVFGIETRSDLHQGVGIQLRSFPTMTEDFIKNLAEEVSKHFKDEKIKLISLQDKLDLPVLEKFSEYLKENNTEYEIIKGLSVQESIKLLSGLEYLIGMRFHACLIAAKSKVKVIGINYDKKVETLAEQLGFPLINLDKQIENFDALLNQNSEYNVPKFEFPSFEIC